jgi:hypothetical protein
MEQGVRNPKVIRNPQIISCVSAPTFKEEFIGKEVPFHWYAVWSKAAGVHLLRISIFLVV